MLTARCDIHGTMGAFHDDELRDAARLCEFHERVSLTCATHTDIRLLALVARKES